jgi:predicted metal-binding membrane protein
MGEDHSRNLIEPEEVRRIEARKAEARKPLFDKYPVVLALIGVCILIAWAVTMWLIWRGER